MKPEERERLREIAHLLEKGSRSYPTKEAVFLRDLASREQGGEREQLRGVLQQALDFCGLQRWTVSRDLPDGIEPDSLGGLVKFADILDALPAPSDSQGEQERCGGSGQVPSVPPGMDDEPCNKGKGCPDCNPAPTQVEGEPHLSTHCRAGQHALCEGRAGLGHDCECDCHYLEDSRQPEPGGEEDWPELVGAAKEALADFDSHGDYEAPVAALRRIIQTLASSVPAASQDSSGPSDEVKQITIAWAEQRDRANTAEQEKQQEKHKAIECAGDLSVELRKGSAALEEANGVAAGWKRRAESADRARDKAEAERDKAIEYAKANQADALAYFHILERHCRAQTQAEAALEELAEEFDRRAEKADAARKNFGSSDLVDRERYFAVRDSNRMAASACRSKAAELKGGGS